MKKNAPNVMSGAFWQFREATGTLLRSKRHAPAAAETHKA